MNVWREGGRGAENWVGRGGHLEVILVVRWPVLEVAAKTRGKACDAAHRNEVLRAIVAALLNEANQRRELRLVRCKSGSGRYEGQSR